MANHKIERIAADIAHAISDILANEAKDSLLKTITITGCDVTNDLSSAKVYFTSLTELLPKDLEKELEEAAGYLRTKLANKIDLRHTPELKFIFDNSVEYGSRIEKIIEDIHKED